MNSPPFFEDFKKGLKAEIETPKTEPAAAPTTSVPTA